MSNVHRRQVFRFCRFVLYFMPQQHIPAFNRSNECFRMRGLSKWKVFRDVGYNMQFVSTWQSANYFYF